MMTCMKGDCIRGESAANIEELLGPIGVGRILLGRRRLPKEVLLDIVAAKIAVKWPSAVFWSVHGSSAGKLTDMLAVHPQQDV